MLTSAFVSRPIASTYLFFFFVDQTLILLADEVKTKALLQGFELETSIRDNYH